jgi:hypothetical protein
VIQPAEMADGAVNTIACRSGIRKVSANRENTRLTISLSDLGTGALERICVAAGKHDPGALGEQRAGNGPAYASGRACDEYDLISESEIHRSFTCFESIVFACDEG